MKPNSILNWLGWGMFAALSVGAVGCGQEECIEYEQRCDANGNAVLSCSGAEQGNHWYRQECGDLHCVSAEEGPGNGIVAFCAASTQPDARCSEPDLANCAQSSLVDCRAGYALSERTCSSSCVTLDGLSDYCVEAAPTHPEHCQATGTEGRCELESSQVNSQIGVAPGAICGGEGLDASSVNSAQVYATRCEDGTLLERQRCATGCVFNPDCSTRCRD